MAVRTLPKRMPCLPHAQSARSSLEGWVTAAGHSPSIITYVSSSTTLASYNLNSFKLLYAPSDYRNTKGGINNALNNALVAMKDNITKFINDRGIYAQIYAVLTDEMRRLMKDGLVSRLQNPSKVDRRLVHVYGL
jgi:hypothetical protein